MTNEQFVEEVYYLAHHNGVINQFRNEITETRKANHKLSLCEVVEIVEKKYKLIQ
jgi:phage FluMu gp28-like protein